MPTAIGVSSVTGRVPPKSPQQKRRLRNTRYPIQSTVLVTHVVVSFHKSVVSSRAVGLTSLIGSTVAFTTAFGLETLVFSRQTWTKISAGIMFAMVTLLIAWCVWTMIEGQTEFSVFGTFSGLKDRIVHFTTGLRGEAVEPRQDVVGTENGTAIDREAWKGASWFMWGRSRGHTSSTFVGDDPTGRNASSDPPDNVGVIMSEIRGNQVSEV